MDHLILCLSVCYIIYGNFRLRLIFEIKKILFTFDQKFYLPHLSILLSIFYYHIYIDKSFIMTHDFFIISKQKQRASISAFTITKQTFERSALAILLIAKQTDRIYTTLPSLRCTRTHCAYGAYIKSDGAFSRNPACKSVYLEKPQDIFLDGCLFASNEDMWGSVWRVALLNICIYLTAFGLGAGSRQTVLKHRIICASTQCRKCRIKSYEEFKYSAKLPH